MRRSRGLTVVTTVLALCTAAFVAAGISPAQAVQATGDDVAAWNNGWNWTYATTFNYNDGNGTNVTINENVTYTVADREVFNGYDAYKLNITGTITGGNGTANTGSTGTATLKNFSGSVSGTRFVRVSDLALLQEQQHQNLAATASISIISTGITAVIDLTLTPTPSWKIHDFPLNAGDTWTTNTNVAYTGGFSYDAGSLGGTGSSPFNGTLPLVGPTNVSKVVISPPIASNITTDQITYAGNDGQSSDVSNWSTTYKNDAKEILVLPLNGATMTLTRNLSSASIPGGAQFSATATPSLTCAGGNITVTGNLSTGASGVPVTVHLDESQIDPSQTGISGSTTTGTNGAYSVTIATPGASDGLLKAGSRANWGIEVTSGATTATGATTVVVTPTDCSTIAYTGATAAPVSGSATASATLTDLADPNGAGGKVVTFALGGGSSVNATTNAAGVATATLPMNGPVRATTVSASYAGSAGLAAASTSAAFSIGVNPTTTSVLASQSSVTIGDPVTFTASVTPTIGSNPTGGVQFLVDGAAFGAPVAINASGSATSPAISTLGLGNHTVQAIYNGDANFGVSSSTVITIKVHVPFLPITVSESVSPSSSVAGQAVTLSSHVGTTSGSGNLPGTVTFSEGGNVFGTSPVDSSGNASVVTSAIPVGAHSIVATYSGDDEYNGGSSSPSNLTVGKDDVTVVLNSSNTTPVSGQAVNFTVNVGAQAPGSGTPTGTVQLKIDGTDSGSPVALTGGSASFDPVTSLLAGNHTVAVAYSGDSSFKTGSDTQAETVGVAATTTVLTATPSPSSEGQAVTIKANVAAIAPGGGTPTGTVVFSSDGNVVGAGALSGGQASTVVSDLPAGPHSLTASYSGDAAYGASDAAAISQTVIAGAAVVDTHATVTSSQNPSTYGQLITFTTTVTAADGSTPSGAVQFAVDGTNVGDPVDVGPDGTATSPTLASPEPGDHTVSAAFIGNPGYANTGDQLTQTVADADVNVGLTSSNASSSYGAPVTFHAVVSSPQPGTGDPTGFVQFRVDGKALGAAVALSGGAADSVATSTLAPGAHTVTAVYSGDVHFVSGVQTLTQNVGKIGTGTTVTVAPAATTYGQAAQFTATVTPVSTGQGAPSGTVTFKDGSTTLGVVTVGASGNTGTASLTTSTLDGGTHVITATYSGSPVFAGSTSAGATLTVAKRATTVTADAALIKLLPGIGIPLGQLRATVNSASGPVAGVPVVFTIGTATVCTTTTDGYGVATCNAFSQLLSLTLFNGYKATFAGNADYLGSSQQGTLIK